MLKVKYRCWIKVHSPEESALKIAYSSVRYLSTTNQECAENVGHKHKRFCPCRRG